MRLKKILVKASVASFLTIGFTCESQHLNTFAQSAKTTGTASVAVGPQYDTTHVYVAPQDFDRFVASLIATFGGTTTKQGVFTVTPTPSSTMSQLVMTPAGTVSVFGFKTPVPYPFGLERTGYLVTDMDEAIGAAKATGADVLVGVFNDPIGRDAIIQWPGGVNTQLYWHTTTRHPMLRCKLFPRIGSMSHPTERMHLCEALSRFPTGVLSLTNRTHRASKSDGQQKPIGE
jgi:hypothetical protein